ncbi:tape measure protein [Limnobacter sp.]|uniref:tape measure protein n=1 Tax=Limnobacter sp. TaxID=2003368 RepID=UPI002736CD46|nr:tape measure protein [Limnobacter sp.]MDP3273448.1 tape measure protein [Limnobacter sp.]
MQDLINLGYRVDSSQVKQAEQNLDKMGNAAKKSAASVDQYEKSTDRAERQTTSFKDTVAGLAGVYAAFASARSVITLADQYSRFTAQLRIASDSQASFNEAYEDVIQIARNAKSDLDPVATLYARIANTTREAGVSQAEVARITESVTLGLTAAGATAAEASAAMLQLSQAFASGVLRGEEFNAVSEAAFPLMQALADSMGIPIEQLRTLAADGAITRNELVKAFADPELAKSFQSNVDQIQTVERAMAGLRRELGIAVGEIDKSTGATKALVGVIDNLASIVADSDDEIIALMKGMSAAAVVAGLGAVATNIGAITLGVKGLTAAALIASKNPLVLAVLGVGAAVGVASYNAPKIENDLDRIAELYVKIGKAEKELAESSRPGGLVLVREQAKKDLEKYNAELVKLQQNVNNIFPSAFVGPPRPTPQDPPVTPTIVTSPKSNETDYLMRQLEEIDKQFDAMWEAEEKRRKDLADAGARIFEQTRTPLEKTNAEFAKLDMLLAQGAIDWDTYARATLDATDALDDVRDTGTTTLEDLKFAIEGFSREASNAFIDFAVTGKASIGDLVESTLTQFARLQAQRQIFDPLFKAGSAFIESSNIGSTIGNFFSGLLPGFSNGGFVSGQGTSTSDSVNARLSAGEFVMSASAVNRAGRGTMEAINRGQSVGSNVVVNVINQPGQTARVQETNNGGVRQLDVIIEQVQSAIAGDISKGRGAVNTALTTQFGLNRAAGALR